MHGHCPGSSYVRYSWKLREVQCVFEEGGEAVPTTTVDIVELAPEDIEMKRKNATMPDTQTDSNAQLVELLLLDA